MWMDWIRRNLALLRFLSVATPLAVSGLLYLTRAAFPGPAAALVLVLLVVGASATGDRISGILAAVSSAVGFDYFLTVPYLDLHIADPGDIEVAVMLLVVGFAVNELALWGGRQRAAAGQQAGFIAGIAEAAGLVAAGASDVDVAKTVAGHIQRLLNADRVEYQQRPPTGEEPVVQRDGTLVLDGSELSPQTDGLPSDRPLAVPVTKQGHVVGHFQVTVATQLVRASAEQLRIAVLLADQLAARPDHPDEPS